MDDENLVPERLLQFEVSGRQALPRYLTAVDHAWLRILVEEYQRFDGKKIVHLRERLREPLPCYAPAGKAKLAMHVMDGLCADRLPKPPISPKLARCALFGEAQVTRDGCRKFHRSEVISSAASSLGVSDDALLESLFADLPSERLVRLPSPIPAPHDLALRSNFALAQGFLQRCCRIELSVSGNTRAIVRQILLRRLLCTVGPLTGSRSATIEISGPYSLFKRTILYGRALASLVPVLQSCDWFRLRAEAVLRGGEFSVTLQSGDPIFPNPDLPQRYDSKLEERFSLDFRKLNPGFDLIREPEPLHAGDHLIFPDFAIFRRCAPTRRVLVEIVGFWTPDYLRNKLQRLRRAGTTGMILCIDSSLNCSEDALADLPHQQVIRFKRRIDAREVLARVETMLSQGS